MHAPQTTRSHRPTADRPWWRRRGRGETGQGALALVLGITLLLATGAGILASSAIQHDPLVQRDVVQHDAYRALEAGVNSYLNTINAHPNLVNCSGAATASCAGTTNVSYGQSWTQVGGTDQSGSVPEYYLWTNPQLCFSSDPTTETTCTDDPSTGNLQYVKVLIVGAAGFPGHYVYQSTVANFAPDNGFLTHVWWSNYESDDPELHDESPSACTYDYDNGYDGPGGECSPVFFGPGDTLYGPVFTNDSVYVSGQPDFGGIVNGHDQPSPVTSADPNCLFVSNPDSTYQRPNCAGSSDVGEYDTTHSKHGTQFYEKIPDTASSDSQLQAVAAQGGCVYSGPTLLSFFVQGGEAYMNVISPDTPTSEAQSYGSHPQASGTANDDLNGPNDPNTCMPTAWGGAVPVPTTANGGNGVIHVANASGNCQAGANPYVGDPGDGAQIYVVNNAVQYNYTSDIYAGSNPNCEGDAFVRNAHNLSSGQTAGVRGGVTVAATNNVVITGSITYTDCPTPFDHEADAPCAYNPPGQGGVNDALGLIADNYVEVNRPGVPSCDREDRYGNCYRYDKNPSQITSTRCGASTTDVGAALCDPGPNLTIDAAILALNHSFTVNNYDIGGSEGELIVYGSLAQDWRGAVGTFGTDRYGRPVIETGYSKYYTWDNRLEYVSIPYYLSPGTPSWALASSAVVLGDACPKMPAAFHSGASSTDCPAIQ